MSDLQDININELDRDEALRYVKRFQVLLEINANINSTMDLEALLKTIIEVAATVMDAEASSLALREVNTGELVFHLASGESGQTVESLRLPRGKGIAGWVAENGKPLIVPDVSQDERFFKGVDEKSAFITRSIMCVPMQRSGDKIIGVLQVLNKRIGTFDDQDLMLFNSLGNIAAIAIENSQLYAILQQTMGKLKEDNTRLNNILAQLKQSEDEVKLMKSQMQEKDGAFVGDLSIFIPPNILQMLCNDMKTGVILLKAPQAQGNIFLRNGEIYHAELAQEPKLKGKNAIYEMMNWHEGSFSFKEAELSEETSTQSSCMPLIIESLRRGDELKLMLETFPANAIPVLTGNQTEEEFSPEILQVFGMVARQRSLNQHWLKSNMDRHTFYASIQKLAELRMIELQLAS